MNLDFFVLKEESDKRLEICKKCIHYKDKPVKYCEECGCVLKLKIHMKGVECPITSSYTTPGLSTDDMDGEESEKAQPLS